jgi:hypothetical protein
VFVINNESGWYEGWMIHDITVRPVAPPRPDGHAQFGTITARDAVVLKTMGSGNNIPGHIFTVDGRDPHFPSASDHFPGVQTNVAPINVSMGAHNSLQQSDAHAYWEFNYQGTNWVHPLYELPFTGGFPDNFEKGARRIPGRRNWQAAIYRTRAWAKRRAEPAASCRRRSQSAPRPRQVRRR